MDVTTIFWTLYVATMLYCLGIVLWANRMAARYRRLKRERLLAQDQRDWQAWALATAAMIDVHQDLCQRWRKFNPLFWIRTLLRDYVQEAYWELNQI